MTKKLTLFTLAIFLIFFACRKPEEITMLDNVVKTQKQEHLKIPTFIEFDKNVLSSPTQRTGLHALNSGDNQPNVSYQKPFANIIRNFLENHPDYAAQVHEKIGEIQLDVSSQTFGIDAKGIIFPVLDKDGKVVGGWAGIVNEERDYVKFYYIHGTSNLAQSVISAFQKYYNKIQSNNHDKYKTLIKEEITPIKEVVIIVRPSDNWETLPYWWFYGFPDDNGGGGSSTASGMNGDGHVHGGGGSSGNAPETIKPTEAFNKNIKLKCIFNKSSKAANFKQYLKNFDDEFSVAHLVLDAKALESDENGMITAAFTTEPKNYNITITFNTNALNRPTLDIARTFMHEMIHAEMYRKLLSLANTNGAIDRNRLNQMIRNHDYPGLEDYYLRYGQKIGKNMQHNLMAAHYIGVLKNFLMQVDSTLSLSDAEALAWRGLMNTSTWLAKSSAEKKKLLDAYDKWARTASKSCSN